jgi:hypothetical protein
MQVSKGRDVSHFSQFTTEKEILMVPGSAFNVKDIIFPVKNLTVIQLEEV